MGTFNRLYGSLAGPVVFLIWLWFSHLSLLSGAQFNAELTRMESADTDAPEDAGSGAPEGGGSGESKGARSDEPEGARSDGSGGSTEAKS